MPHETTQPSLLSRVRDASDQAAWREFDAKYRDLILRYALRRGLQASDAEDVRQIAMLNLARGLRGFHYEDQRGRFRHYLARVIQNAIHRYYRTPREERLGLDSGVLAESPADESGALDREWEEEWRAHHYRLALETVRETVEPRSVEVFEGLLGGESPEAVAERFDMDRGAVYKVKQRVRDRLKELIQQQIREEELSWDGDAGDGRGA